MHVSPTPYLQPCFYPNDACLSYTCSHATLRAMYVPPTPLAAAVLLSEQCMSHLHRSCIHATLRTMYISPIPVAAAMLLSEQCMPHSHPLLKPCYSPNNMCPTYTSSCSHATLPAMCPAHPLLQPRYIFCVYTNHCMLHADELWDCIFKRYCCSHATL